MIARYHKEESLLSHEDGIERVCCLGFFVVVVCMYVCIEIVQIKTLGFWTSNTFFNWC